MGNKHRIEQLLADYLNKQISRDEFDRLFLQLDTLEDEEARVIIRRALDNQPDTVEDTAFIDERVAALYPQLQSRLSGFRKPPLRTMFFRWGVAAAAILVFAWVSLYFSDPNLRSHSDDVAAISPKHVLPGTNRATLTLADGRAISLDEAQGGIVVGDGITYRDGSPLLSEAVNELVLNTPRGGQYQITLSDGTNVWLNAASRLEYPSRFTGNERVVKLVGEAYFAVAKDKDKPFRVVSAKQEINVLGTEFNVSAYPDESEEKTTLVEGSVALSTGERSPTILKPNQQATAGEEELNISEVDVSAAIAWKDGLFNFHGLTIDQALKQVERWYDVDVQYEGRKPNGYLGGKMSRGVRLATFLDFLEKDYRISAELKPDKTLLLRAAE